LVSLIATRNAARGDKEKPLNIYYPDDNIYFNDVIDYIQKSNRYLKYRVEFIPISAGFKFDIDELRYVEAFSMNHQKNASTLGYVIKEKRSRLKPQFLNKNIKELITQGLDKKELNEDYLGNIFAYCLDNYSFDIKNIENCALAILDSTFLRKEDREDNTHATFSEAAAMASEANVKRPIFAHLSPRYFRSDWVKINAEFVDHNKVYSI
jgi:ribonuclease Z